MRLLDKVAIVTGGSKGMGRAVALAFAEEGADIVIADIISAREVVNEIEKKGRRALAVKTDVSKAEDVKNMMLRCLEEFGKIDILVNNAGILSVAPIVDLAETEWDRNMDVNAKGVFLCCRAVARQMIEQGRGGKIVNFSSLCGKIGCRYLGHYSASKFAVIGLTKTLALELAPHKISVNAVCPGVVETDMLTEEYQAIGELENKTVEQLSKDTLSAIPLGRFSQPGEVAQVVVFLASSGSDYMTGQALNVTGGMETH